jgi:signal transduction histidine kinase
VPLPEFMRTTTFRWTLLVSGAFAACILLMFGFVLAQAYSYMTDDVDGFIESVADAVVARDPTRRAQRIDEYLAVDPHRVKLGGLFAADGSRITGNIDTLPSELKADARAQFVSVIRVDNSGREQQTVRAVARRLPDGVTVVIGRSEYEFAWIVAIVERALTLGLIPALFLGLAVGTFLSVRAQRRVEEVNGKIQRIIAGELRQRLPSQGTNDPFDRLAVLVNGMLDEIETLVRSISGVGDDIAHDLRTPLTRVRVSLERGRQNARSLEELRATVDQAIVSLDLSLAIITALLRIAEIEHGRRHAGFRDVALADLVREVGDMYEPIAEDKKVALAVSADDQVTVHGDRDLLLEAIANLVDNAVKFTPEGGSVELSLSRAGNEAVVRVRDTGPGIAAPEQELVARRFYRSDKSRCNPGFGLGLSLVTAIVKLHGFRFAISPGPGCVAEITGQRAMA